MQATGYGDPAAPGTVPPGHAHALAFVYASTICKRITAEIRLLSEMLEHSEGSSAPAAVAAEARSGTPRTASTGAGFAPQPPEGSAAGVGGLGIEPVTCSRKAGDGRVVATVQQGDPKAADALDRCLGAVTPSLCASAMGSSSGTTASRMQNTVWFHTVKRQRRRSAGRGGRSFVEAAAAVIAAACRRSMLCLHAVAAVRAALKRLWPPRCVSGSCRLVTGTICMHCMHDLEPALPSPARPVPCWEDPGSRVLFPNDWRFFSFK